MNQRRIPVEADASAGDCCDLCATSPAGYILVVDSGENSNGDRVSISVECTLENVCNGLNLLAEIYAMRTGVRLG